MRKEKRVEGELAKIPVRGQTLPKLLGEGGVVDSSHGKMSDGRLHIVEVIDMRLGQIQPACRRGETQGQHGGK